MSLQSIPLLQFKVHRHEPQLIVPALQTPDGLKLLSDINDQEVLRFHVRVLVFYKYNPSMKGIDPAIVIKESVAKALMFYYPLAGRLRECAGRKLMVDCTGEGVMFVEADADVSLEQFGDALHPPFPCLDELVFNGHGRHGILNCPLIFIQVTRLRCGGFTMALSVNHTMVDAFGLAQFMSGIGEMARGATTPSILPIWDRHLLLARDPPHVTQIHREYEEVRENKCNVISLGDMVHRSIYFGPNEISAIRKFIPHHLNNCTNFEILTAYFWKLRTIALKPEPEEEMPLMFNVNLRGKLNSNIPKGYYGNAYVFPVTMATAKELIEKPLGFALEKVIELKAKVDWEYIKSVADLMVLRGRPPKYKNVQTYEVSDVTHAGFQEVDLGWGKAAYGGPAIGAVPGGLSIYIPFKNKKGEDKIIIQMFLPPPSMNLLVEQLGHLLKDQQHHPMNKSISSSL